MEFGGAAGCESVWERNGVDMEQFVMCVTEKSCLDREKLSKMFIPGVQSPCTGLGTSELKVLIVH